MRRAVITGASGGLGFPLTRALAESGVEVEAAFNRHPLGTMPGVRSRTLDVSDPYLVADFFSGLAQIDFIVLCHGVAEDSTGTRMPTSSWKRVLDVNLSGSFYCLREGVRTMRDGGVVVAVSSAAAPGGIYGAANYAASKTGLEGLVKSFALENPRLRFEVLKAGFYDAGMGNRLPMRVRRRAEEAFGPFSRAEDFVARVLRILEVEAAEI